MRQILLATALIALPVAGFTGFQLAFPTSQAQAGAAAGIGDTAIFTSIISDVQALVTKADFAGAKTRVTDFELAWDENAKGLRPMDPALWDSIDGAADEALSAVRASTPDSAVITQALATLQTALETKP